MVEAQFILGIAYNKGQGVEQDDAEAVKWYRKAAEQGYYPAMNLLGASYIAGKGVPQDFVQSYFWFSLATSRATGENYIKSNSGREHAARMLTPENLMEAQRMTKEWEAKHPRK